jgi:hypothetical protein
MFASLSHPGFHRSALLRKLVAVTLMVTAVGITVADRLHQHISVVVYSRDVTAGSRITAADVTVVQVSESVLPQDRLATADAAVGNIVVASRSRGAMVSAADFVDSALVSQTMTNTTSSDVGAQNHMVPITLADPTLASLLRPGDTITIVTATDDSSAPRVIAAGGKVIFATTKATDFPGATPGTVLVSLVADSAAAVAAASLSQPLAVVVTGDRAE